ncbi:LytR/AlgR family response regulator transcription factor [Ruminiclostridium hungatei]|nr:LytTR family DNA-binding domain-containing protein [Ruminiclostridium hungatei]
MLPIIICEDNRIQREKIKELIKQIIAKEDYRFEVVLSTDDPGIVLNLVNSQEDFKGIYFLDVDLHNEINGIKLAEIIRKKDFSGHIIFITTHSEMSYLTFKYKVEALDYILKDNFDSIRSKLAECLAYIHENYNSLGQKQSVLTLKQDEMVINIPFDNIMFIEASPNAHKVIVHEENRHTEVYGALNELESKLDENFYRCHRAYLVNRPKIREINKKDRIIYMQNGEECLASFRSIGGLVK